jgi:4-hydroxybenzoate polyprenyltransferase
VKRALWWAQVLHWLAFGVLAFYGVVAQLGVVYLIGLGLIAVVLAYEHRIAARQDVGAINRAFFNSNAIVGLVFVLAIAGETLFLR